MNFVPYVLHIVAGLLAALSLGLIVKRGHSSQSFGTWLFVGSAWLGLLGVLTNILAQRVNHIDVAVGIIALVLIVVWALRVLPQLDSFNRSVQNSSGGMD